jgi:hypothetical protein
MLAFWLSLVAVAADGPAQSVDGEGMASPSNEALEIMKDHMRSQLDWRSYFTNRMDARRRARAAAEGLRQQPQAASTD